MRRKQVLSWVLAISIPILGAIIGIMAYHWCYFYSKPHLIKKYVVDNTKEVYLLGSIGEKHLSRIYNYSMEDLLSAIENINPDMVMLTARADHLKDYGVVDGDLATCVAYSYCLDKDIPVALVDWWMVDNLYKENKEADLHDDNIFIKIGRVFRDTKLDAKILIILPSKNFHGQAARFDVAGYRKARVENPKQYFNSVYEEFEYPPLCAKIWKDRTYFYSYVLPRIIQDNDDLFDSLKEKFNQFNFDRYYKENITYCKFFNANELYK